MQISVEKTCTSGSCKCCPSGPSDFAECQSSTAGLSLLPAASGPTKVPSAPNPDFLLIFTCTKRSVYHSLLRPALSLGRCPGCWFPARPETWDAPGITLRFTDPPRSPIPMDSSSLTSLTSVHGSWSVSSLYCGRHYFLPGRLWQPPPRSPWPHTLLPPLTVHTEARVIGPPCRPVYAPPNSNRYWPCWAVQTPTGHLNPPRSCPSHTCGLITSCLSSVCPHPSILMSVRPSTHPSIHPIKSNSTSLCICVTRV